MDLDALAHQHGTVELVADAGGIRAVCRTLPGALFDEDNVPRECGWSGPRRAAGESRIAVDDACDHIHHTEGRCWYCDGCLSVSPVDTCPDCWRPLRSVVWEVWHAWVGSWRWSGVRNCATCDDLSMAALGGRAACDETSEKENSK